MKRNEKIGFGVVVAVVGILIILGICKEVLAFASMLKWLWT